MQTDLQEIDVGSLAHYALPRKEAGVLLSLYETSSVEEQAVLLQVLRRLCDFSPARNVERASVAAQQAKEDGGLQVLQSLKDDVASLVKDARTRDRLLLVANEAERLMQDKFAQPAEHVLKVQNELAENLSALGKIEGKAVLFLGVVLRALLHPDNQGRELPGRVLCLWVS